MSHDTSRPITIHPIVALYSLIIEAKPCNVFDTCSQGECHVATRKRLVSTRIKNFLSSVSMKMFVTVTPGSNRPKNSEPQRGIEPQSLAFWVSIITIRPLRQLLPWHSPPLSSHLTKQRS